MKSHPQSISRHDLNPISLILELSPQCHQPEHRIIRHNSRRCSDRPAIAYIFLGTVIPGAPLDPFSQPAPCPGHWLKAAPRSAVIFNRRKPVAISCLRPPRIDQRPAAQIGSIPESQIIKQSRLHLRSRAGSSGLFSPELCLRHRLSFCLSFSFCPWRNPDHQV